MDNNLNNRNQQQFSQYPGQQPVQYTNPNYQKNTQYRNNVSNSEMFVGTNILSKIGVIFIIVGVIAFSATSGDYLSAWVRMALVLLVGIVMLVCGELFYRKKSVVFANALIYGGISELFISTLIGRYGFEVFSPEIGPLIGLLFSAVGFLLTLRYKSQGLFIVTILFSILPFFSSLDSIAGICIAAGCLTVVHCVNAIYSRKNNCKAAFITGASLVFVHTLILYSVLFIQMNIVSKLYSFEISLKQSSIIPVIFVLCCGFCYASGTLLNSAENNGKLYSSEIAALCVSSGTMLFFSSIFLCIGFGNIAGGVTSLVIGIVLAIIAAGFGIAFGKECTAMTALSNIVLFSLTMSIFMLFGENPSSAYIALHIFAAGVMVFGVISDRNLFKIWGYVLLSISELLFIVLITERLNNPEDTGRIVSMAVNLVLWFGILAVFILRKKSDSTAFRIYNCLAFLNAGILISNLIFTDLNLFLKKIDASAANTALLCCLLCSCLWMLLGFISGKLKYMKTAGMVSSFVFYGISYILLINTHFIRFIESLSKNTLEGLMVAVVIIVNIISVLTVLDITAQITEKQPKFSKAVGLIVSGYGVMTATNLLSINDMVQFTSWIISVIYILTAAVWIFIGFKKHNTLLRRFGLALSLLASAKLFLFDFSDTDAMGKTLLFIGFGITLLGISFGYGVAEKKLKNQR